ncbi:MAG: MFS transporter [Leptospiraceae bacterium]|nr:MFS transporter [Leptospiraceae bacterium]
MSRPVLRIQGDFLRFLLGRAHGTLAIQMQAVAVHWLVYALTKDALYLGLIGLVEATPALVVALYAGHFADHHSRRRIVMACLMLLAGSSLFLALVWHWQAPDSVLLIILFIIIFLTGFARGFFAPAAFGLMSQILERPQYSRGAAWNSSVWHIAWIVGALAGGWMMRFFKTEYVFVIVAGGLLVALASFYFIQDRGLPADQKKSTVVQDIRTGMQFLWQSPLILGAMSLDLFAVLFGGVAAMLPVFASDVFDRGPDALGILRSAVPAGAFLMSVFLTRKPPERFIGPRMLFAVSGFGLFTLLFALTPLVVQSIGHANIVQTVLPGYAHWQDTLVFWTAITMLIASGAMDGYSVVVRSTLIQSLVPDRLRGKVAAINAVFIGSSNEIGAFESGLAAKILGLVPSIVFGTSITQISVLGVAISVPQFRRLDRIDAGSEA